MAIKFEKIVAGQTLYDRHKSTMGNTTIKDLGEWNVKILSVDPKTRTAEVSWNGNPPRTWPALRLSKLSTWSMYDDDVVVTKGAMLGNVIKVRKMTKAEIKARDEKK